MLPEDAVKAAPVILFTVMSGVPLNPSALVAVVAVVAVSALPVTSPVTSPLNVVAVITPVTTAPVGKDGAPVPNLLL